MLPAFLRGKTLYYHFTDVDSGVASFKDLPRVMASGKAGIQTQ